MTLKRAVWEASDFKTLDDLKRAYIMLQNTLDEAKHNGDLDERTYKKLYERYIVKLAKCIQHADSLPMMTIAEEFAARQKSLVQQMTLAIHERKEAIHKEAKLIIQEGISHGRAAFEKIDEIALIKAGLTEADAQLFSNHLAAFTEALSHCNYHKTHHLADQMLAILKAYFSPAAQHIFHVVENYQRALDNLEKYAKHEVTDKDVISENVAEKITSAIKQLQHVEASLIALPNNETVLSALQILKNKLLAGHYYHESEVEADGDMLENAKQIYFERQPQAATSAAFQRMYNQFVELRRKLVSLRSALEHRNRLV